jgi:hypothetical protein
MHYPVVIACQFCGNNSCMLLMGYPPIWVITPCIHFTGVKLPFYRKLTSYRRWRNDGYKQLIMKVILCFGLVFYLMLTTASLLQAQSTTTSPATGNCSSTATWVVGLVSTSGDHLHIPSGNGALKQNISPKKLSFPSASMVWINNEPCSRGTILFTKI